MSDEKGRPFFIDTSPTDDFLFLVRKKQAFDKVEVELNIALGKFPDWPADPFHALAVLGEEFGELTKETLQTTYEPEKGSSMVSVYEEALQVAAMAMRFLIMIPSYEFHRGKQVKS